eukprot:Phypoly_transcript_14804.p1 GENE.Phypoly_transcript_14804~~Phypoly_transcript_14804.p1  ORF type:complete len:270 (+),score=33.15 Phypoly_transcript_14804:31-840(+)
MSSALLVFFLSCLFCLSLADIFGKPETKIFPLEALVKVRCSLSSADETIFFFNGSVIAYPTQQPTVTLFKTVGMNIGRCFKNDDGSYTLASRELMYYLDPVTGELLHSWKNPWTNQTVTVVHVANDPVLSTFGNTTTYPMQVLGLNTLLPLDIPLYYPNSLSYNATYAPYSPQPYYQAGEFFKFVVPTLEVEINLPFFDTTSYSIVSWTRTGPWLPWMKQGNAPGYLMYTSHGSKVNSWRDLPPTIVSELEHRIPHTSTRLHAFQRRKV